MFQSSKMLYIQNRNHFITLISIQCSLFVLSFTLTLYGIGCQWICKIVFNHTEIYCAYVYTPKINIAFILTQIVAFILPEFLKVKKRHELWSGKVRERHIKRCNRTDHKILSHWICNWTHLLILIHPFV